MSSWAKLIKGPFVVFAASALLYVSPASANLVGTNSDFENGDFTGWNSPNSSILACAGTLVGCAPGGGSYAALVNTNGLGGAQLQRDVTLAGPGFYTFGLQYQLVTNIVGGNGDINDFTLAIPGGPFPGTRAVPNDLGLGAFTLGIDGLYYSGWRTLMQTFYYPGAGTNFALVNINTQESNVSAITRFFIDNVYVRAVPEPGSLALLGLGLAGLGLSRRRLAA